MTDNADLPKLLRAIAGGSDAKANKHDIIFNAAAAELEASRNLVKAGSAAIPEPLKEFATGRLYDYVVELFDDPAWCQDDIKDALKRLSTIAEQLGTTLTKVVDDAKRVGDISGWEIERMRKLAGEGFF
jgi:hypothetical protein